MVTLGPSVTSEFVRDALADSPASLGFSFETLMTLISAKASWVIRGVFISPFLLMLSGRPEVFHRCTKLPY